ncbi:fimbrial protein [Burkholderia pseudomultivorans]|uniref:fimbrial protein n=1 Tax=Burkholderia pseudomultivorans TaxID=1207504 RepID=UPI00188F2DF6|nr:fimbrial protein [Burkholderia pseudomultivorans]MBF5008781.1 fimbrial protein [Burkholderia pseudomultivorans]
MKFICFFIFVSLSNFANAACQVVRSDGVTVEFAIVTLPKFDPPPFDPNVPIGSVIGSLSGASNGVAGTATCTSSIGDVSYVGTTGGAPGLYNTYPTPVSGVGVRIRGAVNQTEWWPHVVYKTGTALSLVGASDFTVEFVKTGDITAPGILSGEIAATFFISHGKKVRSIVTNGPINIRPQVPTCNLLTPSVAVEMGKVVASDLSGVGMVSLPKPFDLRFKCSGGNPGTSTRMFMTLTDAGNSGNRSSTLSLASGSTAEGVGIQILRGADGTLVNYGPDSTQEGNPNQWQVGRFGNGDVTIPFKVRYVRMSDQLKAGTANGVATFTMSYQ